MANVYSYWLVNQEDLVVGFDENKCREVLKSFGFEPMSVEAIDNQIKIANKAFTLPRKAIRVIADIFFNKNQEVKVYAEDDVDDYYRYYKIRTR